MSTHLLLSGTSRSVAVATVALALIGAACGGAPARSGQDADPVALSSVSIEGGGVGADVLEQLVELTDAGAVRVEPVALELPANDPENGALEALRAGRVDVAVLRADTFASAGASSLSVLQLPLLIESVDHAERVAADPVATDLMTDLEILDLVGLALVPVGSATRSATTCRCWVRTTTPAP